MLPRIVEVNIRVVDASLYAGGFDLSNCSVSGRVQGRAVGKISPGDVEKVYWNRRRSAGSYARE